MKTQIEEQIHRLSDDIEHLESELANIELVSAQAVGEELRYYERLRIELQQTLDSKRVKLATL
ncbi:hypothetical protein GCM10027346_20990 [Hymenobacter seoulensis]